MTRQDGSGTFVAGFFFGALVGAAAALLLAPGPGASTRRRLREAGVRWRAYAEETGWSPERLATTVRARAETLVEEQRLRVERAIRDGREAAERRREELLSQVEHPPRVE